MSVLLRVAKGCFSIFEFDEKGTCMNRINGWTTRCFLAVLVVGTAVRFTNCSNASGGETRSRANQGRLLNIDDLEWKYSDLPSGSRRARLVYADQELLEWPPGSLLPPHSRSAPFHGITLTGILELTVEDGGTNALSAPSFFAVQQGVAHSIRCVGPAACRFYGFAADPRLIEGKPSLALNPSTESPPKELFLDLAKLSWSPTQSPRGGEVGFYEHGGRKRAGIFLNLNVFYVYRFQKGEGLPFAARMSRSAGYVLRGALNFKVSGQKDKELSPGSFFDFPAAVEFSASCKSASCLVVTADCAFKTCRGIM